MTEMMTRHLVTALVVAAVSLTLIGAVCINCLMRDMTAEVFGIDQEHNGA